MFSRAILIISLFLLQSPAFQGGNEKPIVRAILFYSPACAHCQHVIQETLLPLIDQYGEQFQIIGVDVTQPQGSALFDSARGLFDQEIKGVPFLMIGNEYLYGSVEIPQKLPGVVEKYMALGGTDWPDIPGLQDAIDAAQTAQAPTPTLTPLVSPTASLTTPTPAPVILQPDSPDDAFPLPHKTKLTTYQRVMLDPLGNSVAIAVLILMVTIFVGAIVMYQKIPPGSESSNIKIIIPVLCVLGLGIAGYLTYVETTQSTAVCGPVGDCNTVQQSEYARLFGVLPIGLIGVLGYLAILTSWGMARLINQHIANLARLTMFVLSAIGFAFSIYLTFLEPFVIGATCAWCITSAILMTALFALTLKDGKYGYQQLTLHKT